MVPKQVERQYAHTVHKPVTEEKVITYTEWVAEKVTRQIRVPETIVVAQQVNIGNVNSFQR
jgi:hypothetical protein